MRRKLRKAREDAAEEPLDLVALAVQGFVVLPGLQAIAFGRDHRDESKVQGQLESLVVLVGAVHDEMQRCGQRSDAAQKFAAFDGVGGLARRESKSYGRSSIRGNQMNLGGPSATGFPDGLRSVFLKHPCRPDAP